MSNKNKVTEAAATIDFANNIPFGIAIIATTIADGEYEGGEPVTLKVMYGKYDTDAKEYVNDEETEEKALETLKEFGASSIETAAAEIMGNTIPKVYIHEGRTSLRPITPRVQFDWPEGAKERKYLDKNDVLVTTLPVQESNYEGKERINIYAEVDIDGKGTMKTYRFSQILVEDETGESDDFTISLKMNHPEADAYAEQLKNGEIPPQAVDAIKRAINKLRKEKRETVINNISRSLNVNFAKMLEEGGTLQGLAKVGYVQSTNSYFPILQITVKSDETAEDAAE